METNTLEQKAVITTDQTSLVKGGRLHGLDFARGMACLSMPIFHTVYNLYSLGLIDTQWTRHIFWQVYQVLGLGTFVLVSGMAFTMSTKSGIKWDRLLRRAVKLGGFAIVITMVTYVAMPEKYVRFGVLHFFTATILIAPLLSPLKRWLVLPGLGIILLGIILPKSGISPEPILYITGLMSERPRSADYIPFIPWLGVFLLGMGIATLFSIPRQVTTVRPWMSPVIWLGKHSLPFYLIHQVVVYGVLWLIAYLVK